MAFHPDCFYLRPRCGTEDECVQLTLPDESNDLLPFDEWDRFSSEMVLAKIAPIIMKLEGRRVSPTLWQAADQFMDPAYYASKSLHCLLTIRSAAQRHPQHTWCWGSRKTPDEWRLV